jgi:epoxyqueuosine reductase
MPVTPSISRLVHEAAVEAGFDLVGVAPVEDPPELGHFEKWIELGRAGEMAYMSARGESGQLKRSSLKHTGPWARSVIVCAINYNTANPRSIQAKAPDRGWISRYAWSREDYHAAVMRRLRQVETRLREITVDITTRCYVDTGPVVERIYAKYAGVGWIGKNTCILNQKKGSWLFLGVILTSLELLPDVPAPDRCGSCTRCIDACPTNALVEPYQLDSNLCISYLTIEKRGSIPESLRKGVGNHLFGCDICQDVCPWNRKAPVTAAPEFQARPELVNPALEWIAQLSPGEFRSAFCDSPVRRTKFSGLKRNVAVAMGNSGDRKFLPALEKLSQDEDNVVAEHARWAITKLKDKPAAQR